MENKKISFKHICKEDTYMFNYTQLPDELFTLEVFMDLSLHAKVLYSFMLRRVSISKEKSWIDEAGDVYIYYRADEVMEKFNCSNKTAAKIMAELENIGLIEKRRQGQGNPTIIYVNKFSAVMEEPPEEAEQEEEPELPIDHMEYLYVEKEEVTEGKNDQNPEVKDLHFQKCKNYTSRNVKNTPLEVKNLHASYKENNYKEIVNSSSTSPPQDIVREQIRLLDEDEEKKLKKQIRYQEVERAYSAQIAKASFDELFKRDEEYKHKFTAEMFAKVCKTIATSKEPIVHLPGFINWCYDNINFSSPVSSKGNHGQYSQFNQFMHQKYDFDALEREILSNQ